MPFTFVNATMIVPTQPVCNLSHGFHYTSLCSDYLVLFTFPLILYSIVHYRLTSSIVFVAFSSLNISLSLITLKAGHMTWQSFLILLVYSFSYIHAIFSLSNIAPRSSFMLLHSFHIQLFFQITFILSQISSDFSHHINSQIHSFHTSIDHLAIWFLLWNC